MHAKNIIWLKFTINYSLFKLIYYWQDCSTISLTVIVMVCVCIKRVCVCDTELVCKAVWLAFSCDASAISLPFFPIPRLIDRETQFSVYEDDIYKWAWMRKFSLFHKILLFSFLRKNAKKLQIKQLWILLGEKCEIFANEVRKRNY